MLVFADEGPGVSPDIRGRLFQPFVTSGKKGGTGLGLAVAYGIVKMHCGDIVAESKNGKGTTFVISIPIQQQEVQESLEWQSNQE